MPFSDTQMRKLRAKLNGKHVRTRTNNGKGWSYIEGWHAIAEANRIFGYDAWDRRTLALACVWSATSEEAYCAAYTAKVRVTVRAGDVTIVREGSGTGEGKALTPGQAHEVALKAAETDATKRALATFGNPFGLALYDRDQSGVKHLNTARTQPKKTAPAGPFVLRSLQGKPQRSFTQPEEFASALNSALDQITDVEALFTLWEHNVDTVRAIQKQDPSGAKSSLTKALVTHLKTRAIALGKGSPAPKTQAQSDSETLSASSDAKRGIGEDVNWSSPIDKSVLTLSEPRRIRSKEHLRYVASQPCLICGRTPSQAHHIRYAQPRAMGRKVSDEFTVPLCAIHHTEVHHTGDERGWWEAQKIAPLDVARQLWNGSSKAPKSLEARNSGPSPN